MASALALWTNKEMGFSPWDIRFVPTDETALRRRQNLHHRIRQLLIRVLQQQRHLPHLRARQHMVECRHTRQPNPIGNLPIGLARIVVAHPNHIARRVLLPKLRCPRIHVLCKRNIVPRSPMARGTVGPIHLRPALVHVLADPERRRLHLAIDPRIQRHAHDRLLERKRLIRGRHWRRSPMQIHRSPARDHHNRQHKTQEHLAETAARPSSLCHWKPLSSWMPRAPEYSKPRAGCSNRYWPRGGQLRGDGHGSTVSRTEYASTKTQAPAGVLVDVSIAVRFQSEHTDFSSSIDIDARRIGGFYRARANHAQVARNQRQPQGPHRAPGRGDLHPSLGSSRRWWLSPLPQRPVHPEKQRNHLLDQHHLLLQPEPRSHR